MYYLGIIVYVIGIILISAKLMKDERLEDYKETAHSDVLKNTVLLGLIGICPLLHWYIGLVMIWAWVDDDFYMTATENIFRPWM